MTAPRTFAASLFALMLTVAPPAARAQAAARTLVLPPRAIGVSDTTATVFAALLAGELERRGVAVVPDGSLPADLARGAAACADSACAVSLAASLGAERVVFGSLGRLGAKVIVRIRAVTLGRPEASYGGSLSATSDDDLDVVAARLAETIAEGRSSAERATLGTITDQETLTPRRRTSRGGAGFRAGFLFPAGGSYAGSDPLTGFRLVHRYEVEGTFVEATPLTGILWGDHAFEWTLLDIHAGRTYGRGDWSPFLGAGLGMHYVRLERLDATTYGYGGIPYLSYRSTSHTALVADAGVGLVAFRTWDFSVIADLRVHTVFARFNGLGNGDAYGVTLSFGTTHLGDSDSRRGRRPGTSVTGTWR